MMGWQSSGDFMQGTHLNFKSREDAIRFAEKQGYEYFVQEPNVRKFTPKAYANNFLWSNTKLKHIIFWIAASVNLWEKRKEYVKI